MTKEEYERRVEATKHMTEFVIKIDNCFSAPMMNTGVFLMIDNDPYLIINTEDFGAFLTTDQLLLIEGSIKDNNPVVISKINPKVRCLKCPEFFNVNAIKSGDNAAKALLAVTLHGMYSALPHTEVGKAEYTNFASRFHVYFTGVPAGLCNGTTIQLIHNSCSPKDYHSLPDNKKYVLAGFYPDHKKLIVRSIGSSLNILTDPSQFTLVDEMDTLSAGIAATLVGIIGHSEKKEKVYKQAIIDLKNKLPKEEVAPQKETPIKIVDLKALPPGAGIKIGNNPPPVTTSKVSKKEKPTKVNNLKDHPTGTLLNDRNVTKVSKKKPSRAKPDAK